MKLTPEQFDALFGSTTSLARSIGKSVGTVASWKNRGRIPAEQVLKVEKVTGIPRTRIRPDLYPVERRSGEPVSA